MNVSISCLFLNSQLHTPINIRNWCAKPGVRLRELEIEDTMNTLFSDTHPKMEALQIELWRQASPTRKMNQLAQLNAAARLLALTGLRSQYPQAGEAELRLKLASLLLGDELAHKVYGVNHAK